MDITPALLEGILRVLLFGAGAGSLAWFGRRGQLEGQRGWGLVLAGLLVFLLGSAVGLVGAVPAASEAVGIGAGANVLAQGAGDAAGALLVVWGLGRTLPGIIELLRREQGLRAGVQRLEGLVEARNAEEARLRDALRREMEDRGRAEAVIEGSEGRWRSLVEQAPGLILTVDKDANILFSNHPLPGSDRRNAMGTSLVAWLPEASRPEAIAVLRRVFEKAEPGGWEFPGPASDGGQGLYAVRVGPIRRDGQVLAATVIATDMSAWKRAQEAQRQAMERQLQVEHLEELSTFKTDLLNTAAHELKNPLTPIRLQLHLLKSSGPLNERQEKAAQTVERNFHRLNVLIQDMRDVARIQSGKLSLERGRVDLEQVVREAAESFEEPARQAGVELAAELVERPVVEADGGRVSQVLFNLVSNAIKFTPPGGRVTVEVRRESGGAAVRVRDTGRGLTAEQIERLFRPFSQVHQPGEVKEKGTGLGLYICKGIIEQHGGSIWAESPGPGQGCTFGFTLPAAPRTGPPELAAAPA
jgi:PAS domain S-box-containing protein